MHARHLFEYATIRIVPRVDREEFINVGMILYCRDESFLEAKFNIDSDRIRAFSTVLDMEEIKAHLESICHICKGNSESGPIGKLGLAERFRWLTAIRSTVVQTSRVHPGLCSQAAETFDRLYAEMVL